MRWRGERGVCVVVYSIHNIAHTNKRTLNACGPCVGPPRPSCNFRSTDLADVSGCSPGSHVGWPLGQGLKLMLWEWSMRSGWVRRGGVVDTFQHLQ